MHEASLPNKEPMTAPLVSVIIPTYNSAAYLREAIDSVFNQTFTDYELIIVDDGSKDNSPEIAREYGDRIICVRQANAGVSAARNAGLRRARGRYVAFLDADDIWLPDKLSVQVAHLQANPSVKISGSSFHLIDGTGALLRTVRITPPGREDLLRELLLHGYYTLPSAMVVEREAMERVGGFDETIHGVEDRDLWLRMVKAYDYRYITEPLIRYRLHAGNETKNLAKMLRNHRLFIDKHFAREPRALRRKAISCACIDAAREYIAVADRKNAFLCSLTAALFYPFSSGEKDNKYVMLAKCALFLPLTRRRP